MPVGALLLGYACALDFPDFAGVAEERIAFVGLRDGDTSHEEVRLEQEKKIEQVAQLIMTLQQEGAHRSASSLASEFMMEVGLQQDFRELVESGQWALAADLSHHQRARAETKAVYEAFVARTETEVLAWPLDVARPSSTDKAAVILLMGPGDVYIPNNVRYVVNSVVHRLGPQWALQIFLPQSQLDSVRAILSGENIVFTPLEMDHPLTKQQANRYRWSPAFFESVQHEHYLLFELDSLILHSGCVDQFLAYDAVGAPNDGGRFPEHFMNGGLTLRKKSTMLNLVARYPYDEVAHRHPKISDDEDSIVTFALTDSRSKIPSREVAGNFAVEAIPNTEACGFHKPWIYGSVTPQAFERMLATAHDVRGAPS